MAKRRMIKGENENNVLDVDWCLVCASRLNDRDRESLIFDVMLSLEIEIVPLG